MQTVTKGKRNATLYKRASDLQKDGATLDQIERTIRYMNREVMFPPVSEGHIRRLMLTVGKWIEKDGRHVGKD
jgi:hypothetical protein